MAIILPTGQWYAPSAVHSVILCYILLYSALHRFTLLFPALSNVCGLSFLLFVPNVLLHMQTMTIFVPGQSAIKIDDGNE